MANECENKLFIICYWNGICHPVQVDRNCDAEYINSANNVFSITVVFPRV